MIKKLIIMKKGAKEMLSLSKKIPKLLTANSDEKKRL